MVMTLPIWGQDDIRDTVRYKDVMKSMALVPIKKSSPLSLLKIVSEKMFQMKEKYSSFMKDIILEEKCSSFIHI